MRAACLILILPLLQDAEPPRWKFDTEQPLKLDLGVEVISATPTGKHTQQFGFEFRQEVAEVSDAGVADLKLTVLRLSLNNEGFKPYDSGTKEGRPDDALAMIRAVLDHLVDRVLVLKLDTRGRVLSFSGITSGLQAGQEKEAAGDWSPFQKNVVDAVTSVYNDEQIGNFMSLIFPVLPPDDWDGKAEWTARGTLKSRLFKKIPVRHTYKVDGGKLVDTLDFDVSGNEEAEVEDYKGRQVTDWSEGRFRTIRSEMTASGKGGWVIRAKADLAPLK